MSMREICTSDGLINLIADTLTDADASFLEEIADKVLSARVELIDTEGGDDTFELFWDDEEDEESLGPDIA